MHVESLLVPLTIPGTKFSIRLQCIVNSLRHCTWSPRVVPSDMRTVSPTSLKGGNVVCRGEGGGEGVDSSILSVRL